MSSSQEPKPRFLFSLQDWTCGNMWVNRCWGDSREAWASHFHSSRVLAADEILSRMAKLCIHITAPSPLVKADITDWSLVFPHRDQMHLSNPFPMQHSKQSLQKKKKMQTLWARWNLLPLFNAIDSKGLFSGLWGPITNPVQRIWD